MAPSLLDGRIRYDDNDDEGSVTAGASADKPASPPPPPERTPTTSKPSRSLLSVNYEVSDTTTASSECLKTRLTEDDLPLIAPTMQNEFGSKLDRAVFRAILQHRKSKQPLDISLQRAAAAEKDTPPTTEIERRMREVLAEPVSRPTSYIPLSYGKIGAISGVWMPVDDAFLDDEFYRHRAHVRARIERWRPFGIPPDADDRK
ncbi:hypothetical protein [Roseomonas genomospecies 6]|uniref:Uncharacterized protein n=1 Tax=Roseomonas genomospecies 6 TaxID=214106 RepID=A0A9W7KQG5_9PROT|nr:hypothetical protein [Roseomonas genomospecies 6]KAA0677622.1 hypothetical protein DS843_22545 [Roseomonas genomospecies 6]